MKFLFNFWNRYITIRRRMDQVTTWKSLILGALLALLITSVWAAPLIIIIASLMVFVHLQILATVLIFIVVIGAVYGFSFAHFWVLKKLEPGIQNMNTHIVALTESTLVALVLLIVGLIFTIQLFGRI